jgi:hypothetical protein
MLILGKTNVLVVVPAIAVLCKNGREALLILGFLWKLDAPPCDPSGAIDFFAKVPS